MNDRNHEYNQELKRKQKIQDDYIAAERRAAGDNSGTGGCFPADAMVLTPQGNRPLGEIRKGDVVISLDRAGDQVTANVKQRIVHPMPSRLYHVVSENQSLSFWATKRHRIQTLRGWVRVRDLVQGDVLTHVDSSGQIAQHTVTCTVPSDRVEPVFNLTIDGDHTFIVQGCVAHSFVVFHDLRCWLSTMKRLLTRKGLTSLIPA